MTSETASARPTRLALVRIGAFELAIDALLIREVMRGPVVVTPFPRTASHVLGAFRYRGTAVPMVDLAALLGPRATTPAAPGDATAGYVMILQVKSGWFAIQVDETRDVVIAPPESFSDVDIQSPQGAGLFSRLHSCKDSDRVAVVLDLEAILAIDDLHATVHDATTAEEVDDFSYAIRPLVIIRAGTAVFAIEATAVRHAERRTAALPFQMQHPSLRGFHRFRDETLAVVDLLALLELPASDRPTAGSHLLIIGFDAADSVALVVDEIVHIEALSLLAIQPVSADAVAHADVYAGSLVSAATGIVLVLEAHALLRAAGIVDNALFLRGTHTADVQQVTAGPRSLFVVYSAGGGTLASRVIEVDSIIPFPDQYVDLRQPGTPFVGLCDRHGVSVQVLDLGIMMDKPPLTDIVGRPVLVVAGENGLQGFMVERLAFLQDAPALALPGTSRRPIGMLPPLQQMIRARRDDVDVSATVLELQALASRTRDALAAA